MLIFITFISLSSEEENLPPVPQLPPATFKPRTPARIQPTIPGLHSIPVAPRSRTLSSPAALPPQLVSIYLANLFNQTKI